MFDVELVVGLAGKSHKFLSFEVREKEVMFLEK